MSLKSLQREMKMAENQVYRPQCHSRFPSKEGVGTKYLVLTTAWDFLCLFCYTCKTLVAMKNFLQLSLISLPGIWGLRWNYFEKLQNVQACKILNKRFIYGSELQGRLWWVSELSMNVVSQRDILPYSISIYTKKFSQVFRWQALNCRSFSFHTWISVYQDTLCSITF